MEHGSDCDPILIGASIQSPRISTGIEEFRNKRTSEDHPTITILRSVRILRRVRETRGLLLSLKLQ